MTGDITNKKEAIRAYKAQKDIGGIYRIRNTVSGWNGPYEATPNIKAAHSRLQFAKNTNLCFDQSEEWRAQWEQYGGSAFQIEEVELIERQEGQTTAEFRKDVLTLLALYLETKS